MDKSTMKKFFIILILSLIVTSCYRKNEIVITDIKKPVTNLFFVEKEGRHTAYFIEINGFVDDTIMVNERKFRGEIDTIIRTDYYGSNEYITLTYKPYKAKKGHLKIIHYAD
jgi:hypothetical protein